MKFAISTYAFQHLPVLSSEPVQCTTNARMAYWLLR